ncbi:hypothetical protein DENSPDRAFT_846528 [Dentipellis sp. KUC8613]|nr:hypothetical protein DENSPDRAFT_846528 [Dentipellis sp. KUC8613]
MAPAQAIASKPTPNPTSPILTYLGIILVLLFLIVLTLSSWFLIRTVRRRRTSRATPPRELVLCTLLAKDAPPTFRATCAALIAQSTALATAPARLGVMPSQLGGQKLKLLRDSMDFACQGLARSASWGTAAFGLFGNPLPGTPPPTPTSAFAPAAPVSHRLSADNIVEKLLALQGTRDFDIEADAEAGSPPRDRAGLFQYTMQLTDAFEDASDPAPTTVTPAPTLEAALKPATESAPEVPANATVATASTTTTATVTTTAITAATPEAALEPATESSTTATATCASKEDAKDAPADAKLDGQVSVPVHVRAPKSALKKTSAASTDAQKKLLAVAFCDPVFSIREFDRYTAPALPAIMVTFPSNDDIISGLEAKAEKEKEKGDSIGLGIGMWAGKLGLMDTLRPEAREIKEKEKEKPIILGSAPRRPRRPSVNIADENFAGVTTSTATTRTTTIAPCDLRHVHTYRRPGLELRTIKPRPVRAVLSSLAQNGARAQRPIPF